MTSASDSHRDDRRAPRKRAAFSPKVTDLIARRAMGTLGDLSSGGLMLMTSQPPRPQAIYQLRVPLSGFDDDTLAITVGAQALWQQQAASPDRLWAGFRIIAMGSDDARRLHQWLARN